VSKLLYHYCGLDSLLGIAQNKCVWACDSRFLNDKLEIKAAKNAIETAIDLIEKALVDLPRRDDVIQRLESAWEQDHIQFVISFSTAADDLSQWRSYGDRGKGVCIGFDQKLLTRLDHCIREVIYGPSNLVTAVIEAATACAAKTYCTIDELDALERRFVEMTALTKHEAFADEHEVRMLVPGDGIAGQRQFRRSGQFLTSYIPVSLSTVWSAGVLADLCVGPNHHDEDTKWALIQFLREMKSSSTIVHSSKVPFREW
jgi:hypothetical protein